MQGRILVVGGAGGIGDGIVRGLCQLSAVESVLASYYRTPGRIEHTGLQWVQADVSDEDSVEALMRQAGDIDGIINTAGFLHDEQIGPEKSVRQLSSESLFRNIAANTLPTMLLAKHGQPRLRRSTSSVFASLSARVGSIADNRLGGWYSYRASKAALNMFMRSLAIEWQRALPRCSVAALHPGTVESDLSAPFSKNVAPEKLFTPEQSAAYLLDVMANLTPENTGRFWAWDGTEIDW